MKTNVIMIGMPGAGKSTVGVVLAKTLGLDFVDLDLVICRRERAALQRVVDRNTHEGFLRIESEAALSINAENSVIATGGSVVYGDEAMAHLAEIGVVVYLRAALAELEKRIGNLRTRGIAFRPGQTLADLYAERTPLYERWADVTVDSLAGETIEDAALKIKNLLREQCDDRQLY